MSDLLTYKDVAKKCKVSERTVWGWVNDGKLKACKLAGKTVRITEQALMEFLKQTQMN